MPLVYIMSQVPLGCSFCFYQEVSILATHSLFHMSCITLDQNLRAQVNPASLSHLHQGPCHCDEELTYPGGQKVQEWVRSLLMSVMREGKDPDCKNSKPTGHVRLWKGGAMMSPQRGGNLTVDKVL